MPCRGHRLSIFLCRRWWTNCCRFSRLSTPSFPSRLSKCPRSPLPVILAGGADGGTAGGSADDHILFLVAAERGGGRWWWRRWRSLRNTQDRVLQRLVEQIIVQRLPSKSLTFQFLVVAEIFLRQRRLPIFRVRQIKGFFALYPEGKSATLGPHLGCASRFSSRSSSCSWWWTRAACEDLDSADELATQQDEDDELLYEEGEDPSGWFMSVAASGRPFFWHRGSRRSVWHLPPGASSRRRRERRRGR